MAALFLGTDADLAAFLVEAWLLEHDRVAWERRAGEQLLAWSPPRRMNWSCLQSVHALSLATAEPKAAQNRPKCRQCFASR